MAKDDLGDNFEEFDFNFNDDEFEGFFNEEPKTNDRSPLASTIKNAGKSFISEFNVANIDNMSKILEKSIPLRLQTDVGNLVDLKDSLLKEVRDIAPSFKRNTNQLARTLERTLPKGGAIEKGLKKIQEMTGDNDNREYSREADINDKVLNMLEETLGAKSKKEYYEEKLKDSIEYKKDLNSLQIQNHMAANLERMSTFNIDVSASFYRKSLELQYRQLDTAMEALTISKLSADTIKNQLEAITKNTALPDAVKLRSAEMVAMLAKNNAINSGLNAMFGTGTKFDRMKTRAVNKAKDVMTGVQESIIEMTGYAEMYNTMKENAAMMGGGGGMAGSLAADTIQTILGEKISEKISKTKLGNKLISKVQGIIQDPSEYFKDAVDKSYKGKDRDKVSEKLKRFLFGNLRDITRNDLSDSQMNFNRTSLDQSAILDNRFYSTVTKTIPMYLSGLLQETASIYKLLAKGDNSFRVSSKRYDLDTDTLISEEDDKDRTKTKMENIITKGGTNYYVARALDVLIKDTNFKFSAGDRAQIEKGIVSYTMDGGSMTTKMFSDPRFLGRLEDKKLIGRVMRLNAKLEGMEDGIERNTKKGDFGSNVNRAMTAINSPTQLMSKMEKEGNLSHLEEMGIIEIDKISGRIKINNKKYKEMIGNLVYKESMLGNIDKNEQLGKNTVNKETEELLNLLRQDEIRERFSKTKIGKGLTDLYGNITDPKYLKGKVKDARNFLTEETREENVDKRKKQLVGIYKNLIKESNKLREQAKKELTKESLIDREKQARIWLDKNATKENIKAKLESTIISVKDKIDSSGLKKSLEEKYGQSKAALLIEESIDKIKKTGKDITEDELTQNLLREIKKANKAFDDSGIKESTFAKLEEVKDELIEKAEGIARKEVGGKPLREHFSKVRNKAKDIEAYVLDNKNESSLQISNMVSKLKEQYGSDIPLAEQETFVEKAFDLMDRAREKQDVIKGLSFRESINKTMNSIFKRREEQTGNQFTELDNKVNQEDTKTPEEKLTEKIDELIGSLDENKEAVDKNTESEKEGNGPKAMFNDKDGDGRRDGSWLDKVKNSVRFGSGKNAENNNAKKDPKEEKKESGLMSMLMMLVPFAGTVKALISGVGALLTPVTFLAKTVMGMFSGLTSIVRFLGLGLVKPILGKVLGFVPSLLKLGIGLTSGVIKGGAKGLSKFWDMSKTTRAAEQKMFGKVGKNLGKRALSKVPVLGAAAGLYMGYDYLKGGDLTGALGQWASTLLAQVPVIGTGASLGIDAWLMKRDLDKEEEKESKDKQDAISEQDKMDELANKAEMNEKEELVDSQEYTNKEIKKLREEANFKDSTFKKMEEMNRVASDTPYAKGLVSEKLKLEDEIKDMESRPKTASRDQLIKKKKEKILEIDRAIATTKSISKDLLKDENDLSVLMEQRKAFEERVKNAKNETVKEFFKKQLVSHDAKIKDAELRLGVSKDKYKSNTGTDYKNKEQREEEKNYTDTNNAANNFDRIDSSTGDDDLSSEKKETLARLEEFRQKIKNRALSGSNGNVYTPVGVVNTGSGKYNRYQSNNSYYGIAESDGPDNKTYKNTVGATKDQIKQIITENAKKAGMNPSIMLTMAAKESSMNPNAKAPTSSAKGLFQFLDGTWKEVVNKYGKRYGLTLSNADRFNPEHSTLMAAEYLKQNLAPIKKLKGGINSTDAYLTHFLGPGGARKFLSANPDSPSNLIVGNDAVNANGGIFLKNGKVRTVRDAYQVISSQLKKVSQQFGIAGVVDNSFVDIKNGDNTIDNPAGNLGSTNTGTGAQSVQAGNVNPFDSIDNSLKNDVIGKTGTEQNMSNNNKVPTKNNYSSGAINNKPANVSNLSPFSEMANSNTGMNESSMKTAMKESAASSLNNTKELNDIAINTHAIATNTESTNKILTEIKKVLEAGFNKQPTVPTTNNSVGVEQATKGAISLDRGTSLGWK